MGIFAPDGKLAIALNRIGSLIVLNLLTILCSLPLFTIGAAMTALYSMTMRIARREEGAILKGYFRAFRENFRQATILWLIFGSLMAFMAFDIYLLKSLTGNFGLLYRILLFLIIAGFAMECIHIFALQARFDNTARNTAKNALLLCVGRFPQAVLMLAVTVSPLLLLSVSTRFVSVIFLIGLSGPAYLAGIYFAAVLRRYEGENK